MAHILDAFIDDYGLSMKAERLSINPDPDYDFDLTKGRFIDRAATHWICRISARNGPTMDVYFHRGSGHDKPKFDYGIGKPNQIIVKPPTLADVLECVALDVSGIMDSESDGITVRFEDWADELGYDVDSRRAERIYNAIVKQWHDLKTLVAGSGLRKLVELSADL